MAQSWLTFCCSLPQAEKSKSILFSHTRAKVHSQPLSCRYQSCGWLFVKAKQGRWIIKEQFYPQVHGKPYPYLQLCTCNCVYAMQNSLACCLFSLYFHFVPLSHWFWEPPGLPHIPQTTFLVKKICKFHMNCSEAHHALPCILTQAELKVCQQEFCQVGNAE